MEKPKFDYSILNDIDLLTAITVLGYREGDDKEWLLEALKNPDVVIMNAEGTKVYLYRYHIVPRNDFANVYFHIQVGDDPTTKGPHDHDYDSQSTILAGAQLENEYSFLAGEFGFRSKLYPRGSVIRRTANTPHLLKLPEGCLYSMSLFCTGPRYRDWGYYGEDGVFKKANKDYAKTGIASSKLQSE